MKEKYKKENFEPLVQNSKNWTEVLLKLGMSKHGNGRITLQKYAKLHNIDLSHFETPEERYLRVNSTLGKIRAIPLSQILVENSTYNNTNSLKKKLYNEGLKKPICELCGQGEIWMGRRMALILDHINGINTDNRLENLKIVCPNCDATLPTFCRGKNIKPPKIKNNKKYNIDQRKVERPSYEQLLNEIEELGYCATGRKYSVSDNTIRKWVKFYKKHGDI